MRIDFSLEAGPDSFLKQALDGVREKLARWKSDQLPAFGRPIGVIVNYAIDRAVYYDLQGNPIETFDAAYRLGETQLTICRRRVTEEQAQALFKVEAQPR